MKKEVYPLELKIEVVQKYLSGSIGMMQLANEYHIASTGDIRFWLERYKAHGVEGLKNIHHEKYSSEFKKRVIEYMYATGASQQATAAHFNIPSRETVRRWMKLYNQQGEAGLSNRKRGRNPMPKMTKMQTSNNTNNILKENQKLKMENDYLKKLYALIQEREQQQKIK